MGFVFEDDKMAQLEYDRPPYENKKLREKMVGSPGYVEISQRSQDDHYDILKGFIENLANDNSLHESEKDFAVQIFRHLYF